MTDSDSESIADVTSNIEEQDQTNPGQPGQGVANVSPETENEPAEL